MDINNDVGKAKKTSDGGLNWIPFDFNGISNFFNGVFAVNNNIGFIVGEFGAIIKTNDIVTSASNNESNLSNGFLLFQNYPNPFNPTTKINYELPITNYVSLKVYDELGHQVADLVNEKQPAGSYEISFNAGELASGIYFYQLVTGNTSMTKKMILVK